MAPTQPIRLNHSEEDVDRDLARYASHALALGATRAEAIAADRIVVDDRVSLKCNTPPCAGYGGCAHCPPHAMKPRELREHLAKYRKALIFSLEVQPEVITRNRATAQERTDALLKVLEIVNKVESQAFYDGHHLAFGLTAGSCRHTLCAKAEGCRLLNEKTCRFPLRSRTSLEATGIDVYTTVASLGWDIYPIGSDTRPEDIPKGNLVGLVVIR
ncbi:MAG: DUF2284 domain-containing protein [Deltaproteobacteria bacterium]|nr:DUF2284 domain-containing protein [Deltaproteobacteria bacterium]